jgi:hypothetical protein
MRGLRRRRRALAGTLGTGDHHRVYAYLEPDELVTRTAMAEILSEIHPGVYPWGTREPSP